ncbi:MAG: Hpt domain-containing protein [Azoarcus sp.]|nr:Hpt domain-containing protein [Azoarcus sp.]
MTQANEPDLGPLNWVRGEIDQALSRAADSLKLAAESDDGPARIQFAQTHLHQVNGALSIIGLDGLTKFVAALDLFFGALVRGELPIGEAQIALARRALASIGNYLDELVHGASDQPLRLLPLYRELVVARGEAAPSPADLFFPDLGVRIPRRDGTPEFDAIQRQHQRRVMRLRFQRGLLDWLRHPDAAHTGAMRAALAGLEISEDSPGMRALWWAGQAFIDTLPAIPPDELLAAKHVLSRLESQLRHVGDAPQVLPERLLREVLYNIASRPGTTAIQLAARKAWKLDNLIPEEGSIVSDLPLAPLLQELHARLTRIKEEWNTFGEQGATALSEFTAQIEDLTKSAATLGRPVLFRLLGGMSRFVMWLSANPQRYSEPIALEFATALLLAETALDLTQADAGFQAQVGDALARLEALARGDEPGDAPSAAAAESARKQQEKEAMAQLSQEILSSLAAIEQTLDDFFRDHAKRAPLENLSAPLHQIEGALTLLGETDAIEIIRKAGETVSRLAKGEEPIDDAELIELARHFSALGFFVQSLQYSRTSISQYLDPKKAVAAAKVAEIELPDLPEIPAVHSTPEHEPHAHPAPSDGIEAFPTFEIETDGEADIEIALEPPVPIPPAAAEIQRLAEVPKEELDAELLCIFIEEAREVLDAVDTRLGQLRAEPGNRDYLTEIRRGFHTLKGSGRMVGLSELGEAAWGMEQTFNRWLQLEWQVTPALLRLIDNAHREFVAWVAQIEDEAKYHRDVSALLAESERLRDSVPLIEDAVVAQSATLIPEAKASEPVAPPPEEDLTETLVDVSGVFSKDALVETETPIVSEPAHEQVSSQDTTFEIEGIDFGGSDEAPATDAEPETVPLADAEADTADQTSSITVPEFKPYDFGSFQPYTGLESEPPAETDDLASTLLPTESGYDTLIVGNVEISRPLFELYVAEAQMHITTLHQEFDHLAANPTLLVPEAALRAAHSCAGISGTARCAPLYQLGKALEHAQQRLCDQKRPPTANELALLTASANTLDAMLAEVISLNMPLETPELVEQLDRIGHAPTDIENAAGAPDDKAIVEVAAKIFPEAASQLAPKSVAALESPTPVVSDEVDEQLLPIFLEEAGELLNNLHHTLRAWSGDTDNDEHATLVKRYLHTFKGSARMVGAMTLGNQIHQLESRVESALHADQDVPALIDEVASALDIAEQAIDTLINGPAATAESVAAPSFSTETAAPFVSIALASVPAASLAPSVETESANVALRVRADMVDNFVNDASEIGVARTRIEGELRQLRRSMLDLTENVIRLRNQLREIEIQADVQMQTRIAQAESRHVEFDPLEMDRYTRLQELTRMMAESVNDVTTVQQNLLKNLDSADFALHSQARTTRELQQALMQVRMVPFDSLAVRLYRIVRQGAKELGKRANLDIRGGGIEIDRSVLDHIVAPLEHLLRNALAHGIEPVEVRRAQGKPEIGQITLTACQEGNEIVIELADDGAGLNFERIIERARERGLLGPHEAPDERRLANLIFVPGFSTAETVSAVSGRGVGMDVVKAETASVGGRVDVSSTPGIGTQFSIFLPLTLAVTQALLVRSGGYHYAIPASMISQVMELKADATARLRADGGIEWLGQWYTYHYLSNLLGDRAAEPEIGRYSWVLLLHSGSQTLALHVDALRGHQEIIVKNAGPQLARIVGMSGATVLGNGEIVLIINPVAMMSREIIYGQTVAGTDSSLPTELPPPLQSPPHEPTVMVVDDSLTVRKITSRMLEREGYRVITAKDGVDAIESLIDNIPDVILSDIEMPRMDGFDFVRNIRADARLKDVPVIMITSRLADKHRDYAMEVGANYYLGKPYQEEELLGLIASYAHRAAHPA